MKRLLLVIIFAAVSGYNALSQGASVRVSADTSALLIGDRVKLHVELTAPPHATVKFPTWIDTLNGFEITARGKIDTTANTDGSATYKQNIELTRFDSGYYVIQPIPFLVKTLQNARYDTVYSEAMLLTVNTVPVDTTRDIRDIKPPMEVPFSFRDLLPYLLGAAAVAVLVVILVLLLRRKKTMPVFQAPPAPSIPPHEAALKALHALAEEKLWQQGLHKQYHTRLTDIVRTYIEQRFNVLALEQTTDEIIQSLQRTIPVDQRLALESLLRLADLVKFAKLLPIGGENETSFHQAVAFVQATQPVIPGGAERKEAST